MGLRDRVRVRRPGRNRTPVPSSSGPDEETIQLVRSDFARRRRAQRWRRVRRWLAVVVVVAVVAAAVWMVFFSRVLDVRRVEVSGNGGLRVTQIRSAAAVPMGDPLARVDLGAVRARVERLAPVRSARVSRSWPHQISISLTLRVPVAVIERSGRLRSFDDQGVLFGSYAQRPAHLPLVTSEATTGADVLAEGAKVLGALSPGLLGRIDHLDVASIDQITLTLKDKRTVTWGSAADSARKAEVLVALLRHPGRSYDVSVAARPTIR